MQGAAPCRGGLGFEQLLLGTGLAASGGGAQQQRYSGWGSASVAPAEELRSLAAAGGMPAWQGQRSLLGLSSQPRLGLTCAPRQGCFKLLRAQCKRSRGHSTIIRGQAVQGASRHSGSGRLGTLVGSAPSRGALPIPPVLVRSRERRIREELAHYPSEFPSPGHFSRVFNFWHFSVQGRCCG